MKSNLEKSVYLGLAALSFAVAANGVALNVNAKSHKHVKSNKVTYRTIKKDLNQNFVFKSTGKNAVYTKPNGVKGAKVLVNKKQMKAKAKSNSVKDQFMAYQQAVTTRGYHYYKVVSFDKKVRGYVFNKGITKANVETPANMPIKTIGKLNTNSLFNYAYGSRFNVKTSSFNNNSKVNFTIKNAVKINDNEVYYNVADNDNKSINGWVSADKFEANKDASNPQVTPTSNISYTQITQKDIDMTTIKDILKNQKNGKINLSNAEKQFNVNSLSDLANKVYATGVNNSDSTSLLNQIHSEMGNEASQQVNVSKLKNIVAKKIDGGKIDLNNAASQLGVASGNLTDLANKVYATGVNNSDSTSLLNQIHSEMGNEASQQANVSKLKNIVAKKIDGGKIDLNNAASQLGIASGNLTDLANSVYATGVNNDDSATLLNQIHSEMGNNASQEYNKDTLQNIVSTKNGEKFDLDNAKSKLGASNLYDLLNKIYATGLTNDQVNGLNDLEQQINVAIYQQENNIIPLKSDFLQNVYKLVNDKKISNVYLKKETNQNIEGNIGLHFTYNGVPKFENLTSDMLTAGGNWTKDVEYNDPLNFKITPSEEGSIRNAVWNNNNLNIININQNVVTAENGYKVTFE